MARRLRALLLDAAQQVQPEFAGLGPNQMSEKHFFEIGKQTSHIDVRISYRIIELFSEGLYSSPNKAVEELVSNSWDAGAEKTHVILSPDLSQADGQIVVIDDGTGMDESGLQQHWLLGTSRKRLEGATTPKGRKPIGKFGIGKLATYVLARRLTHISRCGNEFFSTTMDYRLIDHGAGDPTKEHTVSLPLRVLTEAEAKAAVSPWISGTSAGYKALRLFGRGAARTWTAAIMSDLKPMATELSEGRLRWVLETAMPLGEDFNLFLNGSLIVSSKLKDKRVGTWILGKDLGTKKTPLPKPAPDGVELREDKKQPKDSPQRFGLFHKALGRMTGYVEAFADDLGGKSEKWGQSNGFFVYVRGRRVNVDDPGFGIDRNQLRHGTFSRFRMVVHIDGLDTELRSSRENLRESDKLRTAQQILQAGFNYARTKLSEYEQEASPGAVMAERVAGSPANLTSRPISSVLADAFSGKVSPRYISVPRHLSKDERADLLGQFERSHEEGFKIVERAELVDLSPEEGIALFDPSARVLKINTMHPFVAHFLDEYESTTRSLPLELLAMSEVLLEAHLYQQGATSELVENLLARRDLLLRHLARTSGKRNAYLVAQALQHAANSEKDLENELVNAFSSMGFVAVQLGGKGKPDGIADANLSSDGACERRYRVSLEAKSKENPAAKVSAKSVGISGIARQRDQFECDHAVVVGPDFPAGKEGNSALEQEINDAPCKKGHETITLIRIRDLARLVRLVPQKRLGLPKLRELFQKCKTPEESHAWVNEIANMTVEMPPYKEILEIIAEEQKAQPDTTVTYSSLRSALRRAKSITITEPDLRVICEAMMQLAGTGYLLAQTDGIELNQTPSKIFEAIGAVTRQALNDDEKHLRK
jgi:hypothetical protein